MIFAQRIRDDLAGHEFSENPYGLDSHNNLGSSEVRVETDRRSIS